MKALLCEGVHMYNKGVGKTYNLIGGIMMLTDLFIEIKNWLLNDSNSTDVLEEFERIESKHTRVHHDEDIFEIIRIH